MSKYVWLAAFVSLALMLASCANIKAELRGNARPNIGTVKEMPERKTYNASFDRVWQSISNILDEKDVMFEENKSTGKIVTEKFTIQKISGWNAIFAGSDYRVKEFITVRREGNRTSVRFRARFVKEFMKVWVTEDKKYPQCENFVRKEFFEDLDTALGVSSPRRQGSQPKLQAIEPSSNRTSCSSYTIPEDLERMTITVLGARVRSRPSTSSQVIAKLNQGQEVGIIDRQGKWYKIVTPTGKEGWAHECLFGDTTIPEVSLPSSHDVSSTKQAKQTRTEPGTTQPSGKYLRIWDDGPVNVYSDDNPFSSIITTLPAGSKTPYVNKKGIYYIIELNGSKGYIFEECCKVIQ